MLFCSKHFILFFLAVLPVYWLLPRQNWRVWFLLLASMVFYGSWNATLAWLIVGTSTLDYLIALRLDSSRSPLERRLLLSVTICSNVGLLCYFKYVNFFLQSLSDAMSAAGARTSFPVLAVILPIGISFYTFEAISYVVDVYRGHIRAERKLTHFLVFILFFPHLLAGPLVRGRDFLPQLQRQRSWSWLRAHVGLQLFLLGMVKKMVIGDRMAQLADVVFVDPAAYRPELLWCAAVAYAIQAYCDFSGYTDMARGCAQLLGYHLPENFNLPYLAVNIADFWRRWHMSLSSWLRDYLFFPLGGSRGSQGRTCRNLIIVMTLCGLWHGAAWNYIVFGLAMGIWLCAHRFCRAWVVRWPRLDRALQSTPGTGLRIVSTFLGVTLLLIVFRAPTLAVSGTFLSHMFEFGQAGQDVAFSLRSFALLALLFVVGYLLAERVRWQTWARTMPPALQGTIYALVMTTALVLAPGDGKAFIYFQF